MNLNSLLEMIEAERHTHHAQHTFSAFIAAKSPDARRIADGVMLAVLNDDMEGYAGSIVAFIAESNKAVAASGKDIETPPHDLVVRGCGDHPRERRDAERHVARARRR